MRAHRLPRQNRAPRVRSLGRGAGGVAHWEPVRAGGWLSRSRMTGWWCMRAGRARLRDGRTPCAGVSPQHAAPGSSSASVPSLWRARMRAFTFSSGFPSLFPTSLLSLVFSLSHSLPHHPPPSSLSPALPLSLPPFLLPSLSLPPSLPPSPSAPPSPSVARTACFNCPLDFARARSHHACRLRR